MNPPSSDSFQGAVRLSSLGLIRAQGEEAAAFLHGQLTNDLLQLGGQRARLAGYCSPKGRLLASFVAWPAAENEILLACSADLLAPTLKRLSMFVMRAKCRLSDASGELTLFGLAGAAAADWLGAATPAEVWGMSRHAGGSVIRLPDAAGAQRFLWSAPAETPAPSLPPLDEALWHWGEVQSAVARIQAATVDQFVPQMLNYELLGGVDFKKGCYPGQEVVARSQYRGTTKRRALLFALDGDAAVAGQELFHSADPGQPAGQVVNSATGCLLAEVKLAALEGGSLHLGSPDGPLLRPLPMPYEMPLKAEID